MKRALLYAAVVLWIILVTSLIVQNVSGIQTLPPAKQNTCVNLPQSYANSTYQNITFIQAPDKTIYQIESKMQQRGSFFNYSFCNTSQIGQYIVNGIGDKDGNNETWAYDFLVSPSGQDKINQGEGMTFVIGIIVMLVIAIFLFIISFKFENVGAKIIFVGLAVIIFMATILFTMVGVTQILGGFSDIVSGYTTFWTVIKILIGIAFIVLIIYSIVVSYKIWMIKRGFRD